jgi:uncharacterized membrane protein YphA (DoxX/SURF4 family)
MKNFINWLLHPPVDGPGATVLLRLMAGGVFLWEGILKFVYPNQGPGRFTKLGFPAPHLTANAIACFEIVGGLLLITGLLTRLIALPFVIEMLVEMASTKIALYLGHVAFAFAAGAAADWFLGRAARKQVRLCAVIGQRVFADSRSGKIVA